MEGGDEAVAGSQRLFQLCHIGHLTPQQNRGRLRFEDLFTLGTLTGMAQFNYMIDLDWLRAKLPSAAGVSDLPMWVFHGFRHAEDCRLLEKQAARFKHMQLYKPRWPRWRRHIGGASPIVRVHRRGAKRKQNEFGEACVRNQPRRKPRRGGRAVA